MSRVDVKSLIVQSATALFSKYGFSRTTMEEIAKNIHKAKGVLYYYFKSKEELFNEVLKDELNNVKRELSKIVSNSDDPLTMFEKYFLTRLKLLNNSLNYHETLKAEFFEEYHFVKDVRDDFAQFERELITTIMNKGKDEGYLEVKNITSSVNIILIVISGLENPLYLQKKYNEYESTIEELSTLIVSSLKSFKKIN
ncbi:MAG: TetR/AcrR family transcriptional regulator [Bacteroidales bacterium]|jgi:AcrR family transcriptional regulator|nr:TetR/AcrR family transcriptional regulator [Bacteroidales bacterium]